MLESDSELGRQYATEFAIFNVISVIIFSIEDVLRVWACTESQRFDHPSRLKARLRYMMTPTALIDFIAIAPFYISLFVAIDLRYLRLFRVLRLLKLTHYFKSFNIFLTVIAKEFKNIVAAILMMVAAIPPTCPQSGPRRLQSKAFIPTQIRVFTGVACEVRLLQNR